MVLFPIELAEIFPFWVEEPGFVVVVDGPAASVIRTTKSLAMTRRTTSPSGVLTSFGTETGTGRIAWPITMCSTSATATATAVPT